MPSIICSLNQVFLRTSDVSGPVSRARVTGIKDTHRALEELTAPGSDVTAAGRMVDSGRGAAAGYIPQVGRGRSENRTYFLEKGASVC